MKNSALIQNKITAIVLFAFSIIYPQVIFANNMFLQISQQEHFIEEGGEKEIISKYSGLVVTSDYSEKVVLVCKIPLSRYESFQKEMIHNIEITEL